MDLLETSRMRYTNYLIIIYLCAVAGQVLAGESMYDTTPIDYFGDSQKKSAPAPKPEKKADENLQHEIEKNIAISNPGPAKLYVFLKPGGRYSKPAVQEAIKFKRNHPEVDIQGVLISTPDRNEISKMKDVISDGISFKVDMDLSLTKQFRVDKAPTFVICRGPDAYKIAGQPDLEKFYRKCLER